MLFIGAFSTALAAMSSPLSMVLFPIFHDQMWVQESTVLLSATSIVYSYYLGYRIFLKPNGVDLIETEGVEKRKIISCIVTCILALAAIRYTWYLYELMISSVLRTGSDAGMTGPVTALYAVIIAPIAEEMVFRGWLLKILNKYGTTLAIIFSSLAFGLIHGTITQSIPAFFIGLILGYISWKYKSVIPTAAIHITTNFISVINVGQAEKQLMPYISMIALIALLLFMIINRKKLLSPLEQSDVFIGLYFHSISFIIYTIISVIVIVMTAVVLS